MNDGEVNFQPCAYVVYMDTNSTAMIYLLLFLSIVFNSDTGVRVCPYALFYLYDKASVTIVT